MYWPQEDTQNQGRLLGLSQTADPRLRLLGWILFVTGLVVILVVASAFSLREQLVAERITADSTLATALAGQVGHRTDLDLQSHNTAGEVNTEKFEEWFEQTGLPPNYGLAIVDDAGIVRYFGGSLSTTTNALATDSNPAQRWLQEIGRSTRFSRESTFTRTDPHGTAWIQSRALIPAADSGIAGWWVVLQRPAHDAALLTDWAAFLPISVAGAMMLGGLLLWLLMARAWMTPVERIADLSERVRWSRHLRSEDKSAFEVLAQKNNQIGRLAATLISMEQEMETQLSQLTTLLDTSRAVTASLEVDAVFDNILQQVQTLFNVDRCAILTLDGHADVFRMSATRGISDEYARSLRIATSEPNSPSMRALRNQTPIQVTDTETDLAYAQFRQRSHSEGNRSILAIPLATVHANPAVLLLYKAHPYRYSYSELELASTVGNFASLAMENAALYALKEVDQMKSNLLSTVSHELRTPLATIKGYASTLLAPDVQWDAASQHEFLETISSETDRMTALVQDLLDMSRIEANMLDIRCEPHSLNALIPTVVGAFPPELKERLQLTLAPQLPHVSIDAARIRTVLRNLLENAMKYSAPGSPIELTTQEGGGTITCTVRDYGQGVPAELHDLIFERFVRADMGLARQTGGFGLGLAICKGFVEAHNGYIWHQDEETGATFGFSLPALERKMPDLGSATGVYITTADAIVPTPVTSTMAVAGEER